MVVLLINPGWMTRDGNIWKKISGCMPPLGLAYIASFLEKHGITVRIMDTIVEKQPLNRLLESMAEEPRFIGITATTITVKNALETAKTAKSKFPAAKIVLGGVHPTLMPEDVLGDENVDYVIRGEGEQSFLSLINGIDNAAIPGLSYKKDKKYVHNPCGELIKDLDTLPFPAYHLLPVLKYTPTLGSYKRLPAISMISTRGCPGKCTFCLGSYLGGHVRMHSITYLIDEIKMLQRDYGIKEISFYDDAFTTYKNKVREFCRRLIQEKIDLTWACFARVDFIDEETLSIMKRAGCHQIMYGIESGSEQILKNIRKMTSLKKAVEIVALTKKIGIECRAAFMLGNPGETEETMEQTLEFAKKLDPDIALFNIATPYPGTEMYKWADEKNYLKTKNWGLYDLANAVMELPTVSSKKIEEFYGKAHKDFYGRPAFLIKRLMKIRSLNQLHVALRATVAIFNTNK